MACSRSRPGTPNAARSASKPREAARTCASRAKSAAPLGRQPKFGAPVVLERGLPADEAGQGLQCLTVRVGPLDRETPAEGLVMLLHGAGGSALCFEGWAHECTKAMPHVAFVMPTAPVRGQFTSWFGRQSQANVGFGAQPKCIKYARVQAELTGILQTECERLHLTLRQVVILGYSAGSLMASWLVLNLPEPCAGLVCLHGLVPDKRLPQPQRCPKAGRPPTLMLAGAEDEQIPPKAVERSVTLLRECWSFSDVTHHVTPGQDHGIGDEEFCAMSNFFQKCLQSKMVQLAEAS